MEQRRLRLGDILDDYCPRERRVTNHAVVAMIEEDVKQTRCTTCDAEHAYKGGKAPRKRKKDTPAALYNEVLAGLSDEPMPNLIDPETPPEAPAAHATAPAAAHAVAPATDAAAPAAAPAADGAMMSAEDDVAADEAAPEEPEAVTLAEDQPEPQPAEEGPVHRPLIRATLPRPEGQKDARPLPEFTVRHSGNRAGNGNYREARGNRGGNTARPHGGQRFGGPRGNGRGPGGRSAGGGFRSQQPRHGGKKRSR